MFDNYTKKEIRQEMEANYFACCLLMPESLFVAEWIKYKDLSEDSRIKKMAEIFEVPIFSVVMRLQFLTTKRINQTFGGRL